MNAQNLPIWVYVIGSAAVGALVSAGITFLGQLLERRARRKELLLSKAIELSTERIRGGMRLAENMKMPVIVPDALTLAAVYFRDLKHLIETDELPAKSKAIAEESMRKAREIDAALRKTTGG